MYSNDQNEIRCGLVNYIGAILNSSPYDNPKAIKHNTVAVLLEEAMKLCKDQDGIFDMYTCKPFLRATLNIIKQRYNELTSLPNKTPEINKLTEKYLTMHDILEEIIKNITL